MRNKNFDAANKQEKFNTNNDWGFGGAFGTQYTFNDNLYCKVGEACYRHLPSVKFIAVYHNGTRVLDMSVNTKSVAKANSLINDLLKKDLLD